jgi:hypothetical protein
MILITIFFFQATDNSDEDEIPVPSASVGRDGGECDFSVGSFVVAIYDDLWYIAQVESEQPEDKIPGCILLKYMTRKGFNQFHWDDKVQDLLRTDRRDIIMPIDPPIPVSNRYWGLPKEKLQELQKNSRVNWSIISNKWLNFSKIHSFLLISLNGLDLTILKTLCQNLSLKLKYKIAA